MIQGRFAQLTVFFLLELGALLAVPVGAWAGASPVALPKVVPLGGAAAVVGRIEARNTCPTGQFEAWLSQDKTLLYQVDVSQHGSFEFHVLPGRYQLAVTTTSGCFVESTFEVKADQVRTMILEPAPIQKEHAFFDSFFSEAYASMCPDCDLAAYYQQIQQMQQFQQMQQYQQSEQIFAEQMALQNYYGRMAYPSNFATPGGQWTGMAINGGGFPGHGGVGMGKPVIYFDGKDGTELSVRVHLAEGGNWLVAVPSHGESAWKGTLQSNHFVSGDGGDFSYLFYDYRVDPGPLQDNSGFCAKRKELIPKLKTALKQSGFKPGEILDFEAYWSAKIPMSENYCVFPQSAVEVQKVARLEIEPNPASFHQLVFLIQVSKALNGGPGKFARAPTQTWKAEPKAALRQPAAEGAIHVREWGVAFLMAEH